MLKKSLFITLFLFINQASQAAIFLIDSSGRKHGPYSDPNCASRGRISNFKCVEANFKSADLEVRPSKVRGEQQYQRHLSE